jgi:hypothetical protein
MGLARIPEASSDDFIRRGWQVGSYKQTEEIERLGEISYLINGADVCKAVDICRFWWQPVSNIACLPMPQHQSIEIGAQELAELRVCLEYPFLRLLMLTSGDRPSTYVKTMVLDVIHHSVNL